MTPFETVARLLRRVPVTAVFIVAIALATGQQIWAVASRARAEFDTRATVAAEAAAAYVSQALSSITLAFQALDGEPSTSSIVLTQTPAEIHLALRRVQNSTALIQGLGFIDAQGKVLVTASSLTPPRIDLSDRAYFAFHRDNRTTALRIDRPFVSRPDNLVGIPVSMRAETAAGAFDGLVAARLDPAIFSGFFSKLGAEAVSLVDADGVLYARHPAVDLIAAEARPLADFTGDGAFVVKSRNGPSLIGHSVPVPGSGLFVRAAYSESTLYEALLRRLAAPLLIGLVAAGLVLFVSSVVRDRTRRLAAVISSTAAGERAARDEASHFRADARSKSDFLAHMGHELRTPLNAIIGFSEVISTDAMKLGTPARYREYADDIRFSADHLLGVINRVLDMSKIEAGKWVIVPGKVSSARLIGAVVHLAQQRAAREQVTIDTRAAVADIEFIGDERTLVQLLLNLVINAIKFAGDDRLVRIACTRLPDGVEFTVTDKGRGMTQADAARALRPFETAHDEKARAKSDTGLGLPLAYLFAELHGGTLELESAPGKGTCARVRLPARPPAEPATLRD
jgi:signal transduction histidine kinase